MDAAAVEKAIADGDLQGIRELLKSSPELALSETSAGVSVLMLALYQGKSAIADLLAEQVDSLPLFEAVALGRLEAVRPLLQADPNRLQAWSSDGFQPLHLAAFFARQPVLNHLLSLGADPNQRARQPGAMTPLHSAAASRQTAGVEALLEAGADPNIQQGGGFTALMSAALHGNLAMIDTLLRSGADRQLQADDGRRARDMAAQSGHSEAVLRLDAVD
ncbi:ankyrin repeat domain-containing protein [Pseudomarimonas arenosa]|uniref:Ankyrin repeat domain-containing protein n=1 Tax=Pseudomarimonas arenosa TaxID=2774145 RepID=A0AAW3ZM36_9GAMM|nr:ankyrin repeat domain-containing protein [Pseudomarimonas arenosa]MBD8526127.1 ankyrin repeat domain-containing protein [Pseudomarimonas arenosa]